MKPRIYLDNNATTSPDPRVFEAMVNEWKDSFGNPSSIHAYGQEARNRLTKARRSIASLLQVKPHELVFTSGGTEAVNMILQGLFSEQPNGHIITSSVEHACVYATIQHLESRGCSVSYLSPGLWGAITPEAVREALRPDTRLIALMAANNETGVKTDIEGIATVAQEANIPFFVDAVALFGKEPLVIPKGVSALSISGHKLHGPKGIGAAFIRSQLKLSPLLIGGAQEHLKRGGTENTAGIMGLAEAVRILEEELADASHKMATLRDQFEKSILAALPDVIVNGQGPRVVNTSNLSFRGVDGESLLMNLDLAGIACSHGSACSSGSLEPSRILLNMGIPVEVADTSIRFSFSRFNTEEEVARAVEIITALVKKLRTIA